MKIRLSDYIAEYMVKNNIVYNFTVPGGGAMYLNSSFGHQKGMNNIFVQHEQAAAIAAEAYYRISNNMALVCCTTGPGGTNTLTGVLGAWLDSIPMIVVSGQVKYLSTVSSTGFPMRIFGDQEFDIVNVVKSMTKYSEMITVPQMVKYHLDKALYLAKSGRPGPVWLDIPQNIQNSIIDTESLIEFDPKELINCNPLTISQKVIEDIIEKVQIAERPVLFAGVEIRTHNAYDSFLELVEKLNIPVVTSFDGIDLIDENHPLYAGRIGDVGNRFGNWTLQNSDLLISIGSRLGIRQIGYSKDTWARASYVIMVHEDPLELLKPVVHVELPIRANVNDFIETLNNSIETKLEKKENWINICKSWKLKYPVVSKTHYHNSTNTNPYAFINELSSVAKNDATIVLANGTACVVSANAFLVKPEQRLIMNSGCASMGYDLPAAIGACFAKNKREVICLAGDGSVQMNLQELQTIVFHKLPIKIILLNNNGYHSMRLTQKNLFSECSMVGVGPDSGDLSFPNMKKIANAYGIPYIKIRNNYEIVEGLEKLFSIDDYAICEVDIDINQIFEPKPTAKKMPDGSLISPPLEDLAPFLPKEELEEIMIVPLVKG